MSVQDNVLGAMDIIASSMVSNLKLDKTVQAVVQEVVNMTTGEYRVEYNGNVVTAFALNTDDTYSVNEKVFLKIPENDMNNKNSLKVALVLVLSQIYSKLNYLIVLVKKGHLGN